MQDHRELASNSHACLLRSNALGQPCPPSFERGPTLHLREKDIGGLVQARSSEPISAFRDVALPICFPGLISSRRQPEIGPTSRARLNLLGSSTVAWNAKAVTGPTPGTVKKRRKVGSSRTKRRISLSSTATLAAATSRTSSSFCSEALDLNLLQPTHTHHLGEPPRVIAIGLDGADRKGGMGVASIHADHWKTCSFQRMPEPR